MFSNLHSSNFTFLSTNLFDIRIKIYQENDYDVHYIGGIIRYVLKMTWRSEDLSLHC